MLTPFYAPALPYYMDYTLDYSTALLVAIFEDRLLEMDMLDSGHQAARFADILEREAATYTSEAAEVAYEDARYYLYDTLWMQR